jgi:hypothetical protein
MKVFASVLILPKSIIADLPSLLQRATGTHSVSKTVVLAGEIE